MTKRLDQAIAAAEQLPPDRQDQLAALILRFTEHDQVDQFLSAHPDRDGLDAQMIAAWDAGLTSGPGGRLDIEQMIAEEKQRRSLRNG